MSSALHLKRVASHDPYDESVPYMGYTGYRPQVLKDSFELSLKTELCFLNLGQEQEYESVVAFCCKHINMFVTEVWKLWSSIRKETIAEDIATNMKGEFKQLEKFARQCIEYMSISDVPIDFYYQASRADKTSSCMGEGLCASCPHYLARQFYLCPVDLDVLEVIESNWFQLKVRAYRHLWLATMRLYRYVATHRDEEGSSVKYNTLLMLPASLGKVYEMTNPVGKAIDEGLDAKREQLETDPVPHTDQEWEFFNYFWELVEKDLFAETDNSRIQYVRSWRRALRYMPDQKAFSEKDWFFSPKSSSYRIRDLQTTRRRGKKVESRKQSSYLTSLAEVDSIKNDTPVKVFDNLIGYKSAYNENAKVAMTGAWSVYTQVLNKGKRKLRGIRMSDNATQDRCQYLENLDTSWCDFIGTSCRKDQSRGYKLGLRATQKWVDYKEGNEENWYECPSLYNTDFTDATDTVNQKVLYKFNSMLYGTEIADFWDYVCSKPFYFKYADESSTKYVLCTPRVGNPQGAKKSFTDFHNLHQWLGLMVLRICQYLKDEYPDVFSHTVNYCRTPVEYFFSVLGDDNGFWSIKDDPVIDSDIFPFYDENMGHGGAMYQVYCWLCKMCNWYLNPDKAQITTPNSDSAVWEFAKVTVYNGITFTAPPFRMIGSMASRKVSHPIVKPLALALWRVKTLQYDGEDYLRFVIGNFSDSEEMANFLTKLCFGGFLRSLKDIQDESLDISEEDRALILAALIKSQLATGLASQVLSEGEMDKLEDYDLSSLLWNDFDEELFNALDHGVEHKFNILLDKHLVLVDLVEELKLIKDVDDKIVTAFCKLVAHRCDIGKRLDGAFNIIIEAYQAIDDAMTGIVPISAFVDTMSRLTSRDLDDLSIFTESLMVRGTDKKPTVESSIGISAWESYAQLAAQVASLRGDIQTATD